MEMKLKSKLHGNSIELFQLKKKIEERKYLWI